MQRIIKCLIAGLVCASVFAQSPDIASVHPANSGANRFGEAVDVLGETLVVTDWAAMSQGGAQCH